MIALQLADAAQLCWAQRTVATHHYLHTPVDVRCQPLAYVLALDYAPLGCLIFGRPEATRCYAGGLTYGSQADVAAGRAQFDRWEVLNLARVWLHPDVQRGGRHYRTDVLPGYTDRRGVWRSALASTAIGWALARVGCDYLRARPPCFVDEPYVIRAVLSYCDTRRHRGTIYRAAGFTLARTNRAGIETWYTTAVAGLDAAQDREIQALASIHPRSLSKRAQRAQLALDI